jgi:hypothetical protein
LKQIVPWLFLGVALLACNGSKENRTENTAERFPGFIQVGAEGASARLYLDVASVERGSGHRLKLLRVLDRGYVIQDALTDCWCFKGLDGVQYRDDGTIDGRYPGDPRPLPFSGKPDIGALVIKACSALGVTDRAEAEAGAEVAKPWPDAGQSDAEKSFASDKKSKTRVGTLQICRSDFEIGAPQVVLLNDQVFYEPPSDYARLLGVFKLADQDAILVSSQCNGSGCGSTVPDELAFLLVRQGVRPKVVTAPDFTFSGHDRDRKIFQDGNAIRVELGYQERKLKVAVLEGERLAIRFEDIPPRPLREESCKWLYEHALQFCVEARNENPSCFRVQSSPPEIFKRGLLRSENQLGFVRDGFDRECTQACKKGQPSDYEIFGSNVCSKPKITSVNKGGKVEPKLPQETLDTSSYLNDVKL